MCIKIKICEKYCETMMKHILCYTNGMFLHLIILENSDHSYIIIYNVIQVLQVNNNKRYTVNSNI